MDLFTDRMGFDPSGLIEDGKFINTPFDSHLHPDGKGVVIVVPYGRLYYAPYYFDQAQSDEYLDYFLACDGIDHRTHKW